MAEVGRHRPHMFAHSLPINCSAPRMRMDIAAAQYRLGIAIADGMTSARVQIHRSRKYVYRWEHFNGVPIYLMPRH